MNEPNTPPLEPWLIPEAPKTRAPRKKVPKGPAVVISSATTGVPGPPKAEVPEKPTDQTSEPSDGPRKCTLEQAFNYLWQPVPDDEEKDFNVERATRAVAFLLHWCSELGNEPINGNAANGLGYILEQVASEVARHPAPSPTKGE